MAAAAAFVIWLNAYEIGDGVDVPRAGTYVVWAWAPEREETRVTIGGETLVAKKRGKQERRYSWLRAGVAEFDAGPYRVEAGEAVAALALSMDEGFNPERAMADRQVLDEPGAVRDARALTARHTDTRFTMAQFDARADWEAFARTLRRRILLSSGLLPAPERTPLNAQVFDWTERADYAVAKAYFEAYPGYFVTGNLYKPLGAGPFPGVACPHGHWEHGRLEDGERGSVPGRCITLARMGCVVFSYDMMGYVDNQQFEHGWGGQQEKLWGIHPFGFQLWSSIRALDFLSAMPEVDAERLAVTGASGGGTQTFAVMAVDPRVKVAAPVNMISCRMQGGCGCENAPILRFCNSNQEIGACMAPRPLLMVSATGDWTCETPRVEYPAIRSVYALYGAEDRVANAHIDAGHNYNQASREAMYRFFGRWLLDEEAKYAAFTEPPFEVEPEARLRVFPDGPPEDAPGAEAIIAQVRTAFEEKWARALPQSRADAAAFREAYGDVLPIVTGAEVPAANDLAPERTGYVKRDGYAVEHWILRRKDVHDAVPAILYRGLTPGPQETVLLVHSAGKAALADTAEGGPGPLVRALLDRGKAVMTIDVFLTGEHHSPFRKTRRHQEGRYMDTFQPTDTGCRIQDVLTALAYLRFRRDLADDVALAGLGDAGVWCLFAAAMDDGVKAVVMDANGFDNGNDAAWVERHYMPCIRSAGDLATAAALTAPRPLTVYDTADAFDAAGLKEAYATAGAADALTVLAQGLGHEAMADALR